MTAQHLTLIKEPAAHTNYYQLLSIITDYYHFGALAGDCATGEDYLDAAEKLVKKLLNATPDQLDDFIFNKIEDLSALPATLDKILLKIVRVRETPEEKRKHFRKLTNKP